MTETILENRYPIILLAATEKKETGKDVGSEWKSEERCRKLVKAAQNSGAWSIPSSDRHLVSSSYEETNKNVDLEA